MKKIVFFWLVSSILIITRIAFSQSSVKTWTETSVQDFSDNWLSNVIVTNNSGGEVQLPYPLIKTVQDYNDDSHLRNITKDSLGNYVKTWVQDGNVYVKKYSAEGIEMTGSIRVNEENGSAGESGSMAAMLKDGIYIVVWTNGAYYGNERDADMRGQIFINDSLKADSSFQINDTWNYSDFGASPMANNSDNNFWIFYPLRTANGYKIHVQKRDINGNKIGETTLLNQEIVTVDEYDPKALGDENGFWIAWDGANDIDTWSLDLYLRRFNYDNTPVCDPIMVNDDQFRGQAGATLCSDTASNLLVAWMDGRDAVGPSFSGSNIYGQIFDTHANRIGRNVRLNSMWINKENNSPDLEFVDGDYRLSWLFWDEAYRRYRTYVNRWKLDPSFFGGMVSSAFLASPSGCNFTTLRRQVTAHAQAGVQFRIRTGKTIEQLNSSPWYGPSATSSYYTKSDSIINPIHNGDKYIEYAASFFSADGNSPVLNSVSIDYIPMDTIPPLPPHNVTATGSHARIILHWESNPQDDMFEYVLYRGKRSGKYDSNWKCIIPYGQTNFEDTTVRVGSEYYYAITAVDSSHNESDYSNEAIAVSFGVSIFISTTGNSSGDGTMSNPLQTIQQGMEVALWGDTVRVLPGVYKGSFAMKCGVSFIGSGASLCRLDTTIDGSDSCTIKGLTITQSLNCNSTSPIITENIFRGSSVGYMPALKLDNASSPIVTKNWFTGCEFGIQTNQISNPIIKNNIIEAKTCGIVVLCDTKPSIINNTIITSSYGWPVERQCYDTLTLQNNIFVTLFEYASIYPDDYFRNAFSSNYNDLWNAYQPGTEVPPTNLFLDPQFVDKDFQDFRLLPSSPCIDAGNPDPQYNDADGSRNDMGAFGGPDPINPDMTSQLTKSISVSSLSGYPGDTITVIVALDNTTGLTKAEFVLEFDTSILKFLKDSLTEATRAFTITHRTLSSGGTRFTLNSSTAAQQNQKEMVKLFFLVNNTAISGNASPLALKNVLLYDLNRKEISIRSVTDGAFVVNQTANSENYIYVDSKYEGTENGSRKQPFNTIMEAMTMASTGDTILVSGGDYYETVIMKGGIRLIGSGASVTTINVTDDQDAVIFYHVIETGISGFTIKADEKHHSGSPLIICDSSSPVITRNRLECATYQDFGIICQSNSNAVIENNYLSGMTITVIRSNPRIKANVIEGSFLGAIYCSDSSAPVIEKNILSGTFGISTLNIGNSQPIVKNNFIHCFDGGCGVSLINANNSKIHNNIIKGISLTDRGIWVMNSSGNEIINNTIVTNGKGIEEQASASTLQNNIVMNNYNYGVQLSSGTSHNYNDVWNNYVNYSGTSPGINDISADPVFIDTARGDYRLSANSPCKNSGNPDLLFNDLDGSRNDIGAYGGSGADLDWLQLQNSSLAIDTVSSKLTDTVRVAIKGKKMNGIAGFDCSLSYDQSILTMIQASTTDMTKSFSLEKDRQDSGLVHLILNSPSGVREDDGELLSLYFAVKAHQSMNTSLRLDSAKVKNEATFVRNIYDLGDGIISISINGIEGNKDNDIPKSYTLHQNYPNPFNPRTKIRYEIPKESKVSIIIFDVLGREVISLFGNNQKLGKYEVEWNAEGCPSGIYFCQMKAGDFFQTKKLVLLK